MRDIKGMNERYVHYGLMEDEVCRRVKASAVKFKTWIDIRPELCGEGFAHMQHDYETQKRGGQGQQGDLTFRNDENWGLNNETLHEYVF